MLPLSQIESNQKPLLIHTVHEDDEVLLNTPDAEWFRVLYYFPWEKHRVFGAEYYDALYEFNKREERKRQERDLQKEVVLSQSKEDARQLLLFDRVTMQVDKEKKSKVLYEVEAESKVEMVNPFGISPGVAPFRLGGKRPKCFFALLKSFLGTALMGFPCEPEKVSMLLRSNPSFVRVCGFAPKGERDEYCSRHIPSERKLQQFDQIMSEWGLWEKMKIALVTENIETGAIKIEKEVVGDTTHYYAYSGLNPRRQREVTEGLPRGMEKITPYGVVICNGGHEMDYKGMRYEKEKFIYHTPTDPDGEPVCSTCVHQVECCPNSLTGRMINISFGLLPHIDTEDPPMAKRFKAIMTRRPSVERMIKRLKCDIGDDRLSKRGNLSFQAYLDKTMIAFHLLLQN